MKNAKRLLALAVALVMCLPLAAPALADDGDQLKEDDADTAGNEEQSDMGQWYSCLAVDTTALPPDEPFYNKLEPLFRRCVEERSGAVVTEDGDAEFVLSFVLDQSLAEEAFRIGSTQQGVQIAGADFNALVFGMGRFLHRSRYNETGMQPTDWRGTSAPETALRTVYFATHFYNSYQQCEPEDMERYIEDLMLWGFNAVYIGFPGASGEGDISEDPAVVLYQRAMAAAKGMNMKTIVGDSNVVGSCSNPDILADKSLLPDQKGVPICPSTEEGYEFLAAGRNWYLNELATAGFDYLIFWPYDEGGCSCEKCWPWGARGYYDYAKRVSAEVRAQWPDTKVILSTWLFGSTSSQGTEWPEFYKRVQADEEAGDHWIDVLLIATQDRDCNKYVLEHGMPSDQIRLATFPDICMLGEDPWGGFGAAVAPSQVCREQRMYQDITEGCILYSEGIFDDLNKVVCADLFWDSAIAMEDTIRDYLGYEFPMTDIESGLRMIELIDQAHDLTKNPEKSPVDLSIPEEASRLAEELDGQIIPKLKTSWRWRILYIRAMLDRIRYENCAADDWPLWRYSMGGRSDFLFWGSYLEGDEEAEQLMLELIHIYHAMEVNDPWKYIGHIYVRPPLQNG